MDENLQSAMSMAADNARRLSEAVAHLDQDSSISPPPEFDQLASLIDASLAKVMEGDGSMEFADTIQETRQLVHAFKRLTGEGSVMDAHRAKLAADFLHSRMGYLLSAMEHTGP